MSETALRRTVLVVAGLSILGVLALAGATHYLGETGPAPDGERPDPTLVQPVPNGSELWPYTSRSRDFGGRTLAINVVATGDAAQVRREFRRQVDANWTTKSDPTAPANETVRVLEIADQTIVWEPAHGATRYGYVQTADGTGQWFSESYQLYDGAYLGARHHVRAYSSPDDDWTAMQSHREYWDWFRLRHTVTSTADTQRYVDDLFLDDPRTERVYKVHLRNGDRKDGNGWATVVEFAALLGLLVGAGRQGYLLGKLRDVRKRLSPERRAHLGHLVALFGAVLAVFLGVRVGGVVLEARLPDLSPKVVAGVLYPVLAVGLPFAAFRRSRVLPPEDAFATATVALVAGFVVEYAYLELEVIPVDLLLHRVALILALGLVAAAGAVGTDDSESRRQFLALGVAGWVVALGLPLLGLL